GVITPNWISPAEELQRLGLKKKNLPGNLPSSQSHFLADLSLPPESV
ncbi:unnamed protein product, partial [Allacma fusca]